MSGGLSERQQSMSRATERMEAVMLLPAWHAVLQLLLSLLYCPCCLAPQAATWRSRNRRRGSGAQNVARSKLSSTPMASSQVRPSHCCLLSHAGGRRAGWGREQGIKSRLPLSRPASASFVCCNPCCSHTTVGQPLVPSRPCAAWCARQTRGSANPRRRGLCTRPCSGRWRATAHERPRQPALHGGHHAGPAAR